ncbi:MAG: hypothetical protein ACJA2N_000115 [Salibacteraceae bacterium]|jgi:hypothetical protein
MPFNVLTKEQVVFFLLFIANNGWLQFNEILIQLLLKIGRIIRTFAALKNKNYGIKMWYCRTS